MKFSIYFLFLLPLLGAGCFGSPASDDSSLDAPPDSMNEETVPGAQENDSSNSVVWDYINGDTATVFEDSALTGLSSSGANITVDSPLPGDVVSDSFTIEGSARVFENTVSYRIKDESGTTIMTGFDTADSPDVGQFGDYSLPVDLSSYPAGLYTIEVYWQSAKDGSDADLVSYIVEKQ